MSAIEEAGASGVRNHGLVVFESEVRSVDGDDPDHGTTRSRAHAAGPHRARRRYITVIYSLDSTMYTDVSRLLSLYYVQLCRLYDPTG